MKKEAHSGDDEEYKPVKKRVAVSKGPGRGRGPRGPRGASRSCKHCSEVFNRWDDWRDHEKECKLRPTSANKTCKYCGHVTKRVGQVGSPPQFIHSFFSQLTSGNAEAIKYVLVLIRET